MFVLKTPEIILLVLILVMIAVAALVIFLIVKKVRAHHNGRPGVSGSGADGSPFGNG